MEKKIPDDNQLSNLLSTPKIQMSTKLLSTVDNIQSIFCSSYSQKLGAIVFGAQLKKNHLSKKINKLLIFNVNTNKLVSKSIYANLL